MSYNPWPLVLVGLASLAFLANSMAQQTAQQNSPDQPGLRFSDTESDLSEVEEVDSSAVAQSNRRWKNGGERAEPATNSPAKLDRFSTARSAAEPEQIKLAPIARERSDRKTPAGELRARFDTAGRFDAADRVAAVPAPLSDLDRITDPNKLPKSQSLNSGDFEERDYKQESADFFAKVLSQPLPRATREPGAKVLGAVVNAYDRTKSLLSGTDKSTEEEPAPFGRAPNPQPFEPQPFKPRPAESSTVESLPAQTRGGLREVQPPEARLFTTGKKRAASKRTGLDRNQLNRTRLGSESSVPRTSPYTDLLDKPLKNVLGTTKFEPTLPRNQQPAAETPSRAAPSRLRKTPAQGVLRDTIVSGSSAADRDARGSFRSGRYGTVDTQVKPAQAQLREPTVDRTADRTADHTRPREFRQIADRTQTRETIFSRPPFPETGGVNPLPTGRGQPNRNTLSEISPTQPSTVGGQENVPGGTSNRLRQSLDRLFGKSSGEANANSQLPPTSGIPTRGGVTGGPLDPSLAAAGSTPNADSTANTEFTPLEVLPRWMTLALIASIAASLFFSWIAWHYHAQYRDLVEDMAEGDVRRERQDRRLRDEVRPSRRSRDSVRDQVDFAHGTADA